jgi:hypothetical protein
MQHAMHMYGTCMYEGGSHLPANRDIRQILVFLPREEMIDQYWTFYTFVILDSCGDIARRGIRAELHAKLGRPHS